MPVFPNQQYSKFRGYRPEKAHRYSQDYIGTWKPKTALRIAKQLRKEGFRVCARGRGPRGKDELNRTMFPNHLPLRFATHIALYIRNSKVAECKFESEIDLTDARVKAMVKMLDGLHMSRK